MYKITSILLILLFKISFAQTPLPDAPELYMKTTGKPVGDTLTFELSKLSTAFCYDWNDPTPPDFVECDSCADCNDCLGGEIVDTSASIGWSICFQQGGLDHPSYGFGVYKLSLQGTANKHVYLDFRDNNYSNNTGLPDRYEVDVWVRFHYDGSYPNSYFEWRPASTGSYERIDDEEIRHIWDIFDPDEPETSYFPSDYWSNCLIMINQYDEVGLIWGAHPTFDADSYKIYRKDYGQKAYSLIATVVSTVFNYNDDETDYCVTNASYYYVRAYNGSYSAPTNTVYNTCINKAKRSIDRPTDKKYMSNLYQNQPNPFNPSTNITYSIASKSNVTLRVFNSLGQEVATLVNEIQGKGNYTVPFDARNLPSGIYFYQLITDNFTDVKKMVVAK
ncbi:T9SS type A sorting domain-containing protein [Bacteroidota bacterium]